MKTIACYLLLSRPLMLVVAVPASRLAGANRGARTALYSRRTQREDHCLLFAFVKALVGSGAGSRLRRPIVGRLSPIGCNAWPGCRAAWRLPVGFTSPSGRIRCRQQTQAADRRPAIADWVQCVAGLSRCLAAGTHRRSTATDRRVDRSNRHPPAASGESWYALDVAPGPGVRRIAGRIGDPLRPTGASTGPIDTRPQPRVSPGMRWTSASMRPLPGPQAHPAGMAVTVGLAEPAARAGPAAMADPEVLAASASMRPLPGPQAHPAGMAVTVGLAEPAARAGPAVLGGVGGTGGKGGVGGVAGLGRGQVVPRASSFSGGTGGAGGDGVLGGVGGTGGKGGVGGVAGLGRGQVVPRASSFSGTTYFRSDDPGWQRTGLRRCPMWRRPGHPHFREFAAEIGAAIPPYDLLPLRRSRMAADGFTSLSDVAAAGPPTLP